MGGHGWGVAAGGVLSVGLWALLGGLAVAGPADRGPSSGGAGAAERPPTRWSGPERPDAEPRAVQEGAALVRALGCGECHRGVEGGGLAARAAPAFGPDGIPLDPGFVFTYLADPGIRRPEIAPARMPDFRLSERERLALGLFLAGEPDDGPAARAREEHAELDAEDGRRLFDALNCGACHAHPAARPWADAPDLAMEAARVREPWLRRYLEAPEPVRPSGHRPGIGSRMPDFRLEADEVEAVLAYLTSLSSPAAPPREIASAPTPFRARRTERLVRDRLSCLGCHAMGGEGGRIGPPLDGVAERLHPAFLREMIHRPRRTVPGAEMPTPLFAGERLDEVARWLAHGDGAWEPAEAVPTLELPGAVGTGPVAGAGPPGGNIAPGGGAPMAEDAALYERWCAHCHGPEGRGDGWNAAFLDTAPADHASDSLMSLRPDDTLYDGIHAGAWVLDGSPRMPAFGATLDRARIRALVGYIRTLCDCVGPPWSRDGGAGGPP